MLLKNNKVQKHHTERKKPAREGYILYEEMKLNKDVENPKSRKGQDRTFWDNGNVVYLGYCGDDMGASICQSSWICTLKI